MTYLTNPKYLKYKILSEIIAPPLKVDYVQYAKDNIVFASNDSAVPGPYNEDAFKYFSEILYALSPQDPCRIVTLMKSAQIGGTVIGIIFGFGTIELIPCKILYYHPTEDNARRWSKDKAEPFIRNIPSLKKALAKGSKHSGNSLMYKEREDGRGSLRASGANSPASLSGASVPVQIQDDLSKWENLERAGDPEDQANSRSKAFPFAKIFKISTPLVAPGCRITNNFNAGSQEYFYVPCPHCGHMHTLEWENLKQNINEEEPEKSHFTCPECGGVIEDHHRREMTKQGEWRASNTKEMRYHRSFYIWAAYSSLTSIEFIVRDWLIAKGNPERERVFYNDTVGLAYEASGDAPAWEPLKTRADNSHYKRGEVPEGVILITCGVDVQKNRLEYQFVGWGRNNTRYVLDYGVIEGGIDNDFAKIELDNLLAKKWKFPNGHICTVDRLAIDFNYESDLVRAWAKRHPISRVMLVRGVPSETVSALIKLVKKQINNKGKAYTRASYNFATSQLKLNFYKCLERDDPDFGSYVYFPQGCEDDYFIQLTSEQRTLKTSKTGFHKYLWILPEGLRNEALDTHMMAEAAAIYLSVRKDLDAIWEKYEARLNPSSHDQGDIEDLLKHPSTHSKPSKKQNTNIRFRI